MSLTRLGSQIYTAIRGICVPSRRKEGIKKQKRGRKGRKGTRETGMDTANIEAQLVCNWDIRT